MKKLMVFGVAAVVGGMFLLRGGDAPTELDAGKTTWKNQVWIDTIPVHETDKVNILVAIDDPHLGLFQSASQWEGDYSIFSWTDPKGDGTRANIEMMQTGEKHKLRFEISSKDCGRFDICMKVKGAPRGPKAYYTMRDWVIEGGSAHSPGEIAEMARSLIAAGK